jgi:hypothetical protein
VLWKQKMPVSHARGGHLRVRALRVDRPVAACPARVLLGGEVLEFGCGERVAVRLRETGRRGGAHGRRGRGEGDGKRAAAWDL